MDLRFELGNSMIICGPSKAGKTTWILNLITHRRELFQQPIGKIYWFYGVWQESYAKLSRLGVIPKEGVEKEAIEAIEPRSLVVLDDLMIESENSQAVTSLFTRLVHHRELFLCYVTQNFYHQSKEACLRHLNSHYIVFFKNPRDKTQISMLARQMCTGKSTRSFVELFENITEDKAFAYLLIDLRQSTPNDIRIRTNIFPSEYPPIAYK